MRLYKKMLLAGVTLLASGISAQAQVAAGSEYLLKLDGTDLYLSAQTGKAGSESSLSLENVLQDGFDQNFTFTVADGGYTLAVGTGMTVVRDSWNMRYKNTVDVDLTSKDVIFAIETQGNGIKLKNLGSGKYVGCDSRNTGSHVYSDKTGDAVCVFILQTKADILKPALEALIAEANALLSSTQEGDAVGQYPAEARQALTYAIADAESVKNSIDETLLSDTISALRIAIGEYKDSVHHALVTEGIYKFKHVAGDNVYLASGWHANSWESWNNEHTALFLNDGQSGYNFEFTVSSVPGYYEDKGVYNILDNEGNRLVNADGKLLVNGDTAYTDRNALFTVEPQSDNQWRIRSMATGNCVGPNDNTKGWTWIHAGTNHTGNENGDLFIAELVKATPTGVSLTEGDENAPAVYYNLNGTRVDGASLTPGIYVIRHGAKSTKVLVK